VLRVVILDNNAISRGLLKSVLANGGHDVVGDANASLPSITRLVKLQPQIVCIDLENPENSGMELLDTLKEALPKAMIFIVSGKLVSSTLQEAMSRGVHGFIVKPFNSVVVLGTIRNAIIKIARQHAAGQKEMET